MGTIQEDVMDLTQEAGFEVSTGKLEARLEELQKAQRRADRELLEWTMQLELADEAMYAGGILEASTEEEHRRAAIDLNTLQERINRLLAGDAGEGWARSSSKEPIERGKSETRSVERKAR
jgi:hypothetical protein